MVRTVSKPAMKTIMRYVTCRLIVGYPNVVAFDCTAARTMMFGGFRGLHLLFRATNNHFDATINRRGVRGRQPGLWRKDQRRHKSVLFRLCFHAIDSLDRSSWRFDGVYRCVLVSLRRSLVCRGRWPLS
jgi:hypothetical protein